MNLGAHLTASVMLLLLLLLFLHMLLRWHLMTLVSPLLDVRVFILGPVVTIPIRMTVAVHLISRSVDGDGIVVDTLCATLLRTMAPRCGAQRVFIFAAPTLGVGPGRHPKLLL
jgi:hypothetical protein